MDTILHFASLAVCGWGVAHGINGIIDFTEGKSQQNAGKKDEGMSKIISAAVIVALGIAVPSIINSTLGI